MKSGNPKTCFDCFNCKVSSKSSDKNKLFYCNGAKKKKRHRGPYWVSKQICKKFDDADA
jgi:hypothetical protein